jgi:hypothetical protein
MGTGWFQPDRYRSEKEHNDRRRRKLMSVGDGWELPPGAEPWSDFHWFQPSVREALEIVVLSDEPAWYTGHYVGGRMCPCCGSGCEFCGAGIGAQVRYVFAVAALKTRRVGLIELGKSNGQLVRDWIARAGQLRGMVLDVSKHGKSMQSRTELEFVEHVCPPWYLSVPVPDCHLALYLTWHKASMEMPQQFRERMSDKLSEGAPKGERRFVRPLP